MSKTFLRSFFYSLIFAIFCIVVSVQLGQVNFNFFQELFKGYESKFSMLILLREYRVIAGFCTGAALSVSGVILQALLRNPLAEPFILGISSGAALGAGTFMVLFSGYSVPVLTSLPLFAFIGALLAISLVFLLGSMRGRLSISGILLSGVVISTIASSILMFLVTLFPQKMTNGVLWWLLGDLQLLDPVTITILSVSTGAVILLSFFFSRDLNALTLGDETAHFLGSNTQMVRIVLFLLTSYLTAITVSSCGVIGFIGLIIPHICRLLFGIDHRRLLVCSALIGGGFLVLTDGIARTVIHSYEIPIGIVTSLIGGPLFLFLMRKKMKQKGNPV